MRSLALLLALSPAIAGEEPLDATRLFAERMFDTVRAEAVDCPESSGRESEAHCARFPGAFSAFKFRWDEGARLDFQGEFVPQGSWKRKPDGYLREYDLEAATVIVRFVEKAARVEATCRPPEPETEEETVVSTRLKLREELLDCPSEDELPEDLSGVTPPILVRESDKDPIYPPTALERGLSGSVTLRLLVDRDGTVKSANVLRSANPGRGFEEAASAAARQWRYEAARYLHRPVQFCLEVVVEFELPGGG